MTKPFTSDHVLFGVVLVGILLFSGVDFFATAFPDLTEKEQWERILCEPDKPESFPSCFDEDGVGAIRCVERDDGAFVYDVSLCFDVQPVKAWIKEKPLEFVRTHVLLVLAAIIFLSVMGWVFSEDRTTKKTLIQKLSGK